MTPSVVADVRQSSLRMLVSFVGLSAGQTMLGERDATKIVTRATVGATVAEGTARLLQLAQREGDLSRPLDPLLLASYGERELQKFADLVQLAQLRQRVR